MSAVVKLFLKKYLGPKQIDMLKRHWTFIGNLFPKVMYPYGRFIKTPLNLLKNSKNKHRKLDIGPGAECLAGFETVNVVWGRNVDYVADASKKLPFADGTFELVHASHVLEHIPWYLLVGVIEEWNRIISPGGYLEIWVPNGLKIAKTFVAAEEGTVNNIDKDGWYKFNDLRDSCIWANGRIFSYGNGTGKKNDPNWHLSIFSPRFLQELLEKGGFVEVEDMGCSKVRGHDHGWINLGLRGRKP